MSIYSCYSIFDITKLSNINETRDKHLQYVKDNIDSITFGGVIQDENDMIIGILMIIKAKNKNEAVNFIKNDPYFELYQSYDVNLFSQRIPKI